MDWFQRSHTQAPTKLRLFGERNSGTNLVESLLLQNFPQMTLVRNYPFEKHAFFDEAYVTRDMLCVCVVRSADVWFKSCFRSQHQIWAWAKELSFSEFLRHEWSSHFSGHILADKTKKLGLNPKHELLMDRHPLTGDRIANIVELRKLKLQSYLKIPKLHWNYAFIRYEDVVADQSEFIAGFAKQLDLQMPSEPQEISKNLSRAKEVRHDMAHTLPSYADYSPEDARFIDEWMDRDLEARFGYRYADELAAH